jgi:hypothetical protein
MGRGGVGKMADCSMERQGRRWWVDQRGCLDPTEIEPYGGSSAEKEEKKVRRKIEDRLGHRHKHSGKRPAC